MSSARTEGPAVAGKFMQVAGEKLYVRGVTYGTFQRTDDGGEFPARDVVAKDFALMADNGINAVRTYTVPRPWLLDEAHEHGLRVMVGIPAEQYVGYLADRKNAPNVAEIVRGFVRESVGHPGVLGYTIGNEIPAGSVRWHGPRRIERYLERLYLAAKLEDPDALVTYANYPTTEYLKLDFLDVVAFNVFLESPTDFGAYIARLQNIAGDRPLIITEMGLDGLRNGEVTQAESLDRLTREAFAEGCAGVFVFSWTDEWHTGGNDIDDWQFGITRRDRSQKPALETVRRSFAAVPFSRERSWPKVSVVVCSYNGASRLDECLDGIARLEYPDYETIVVDNGSSDNTSTVAGAHPDVRLIRTPPTGLSDARNVGLRAAKGEIVAYIDDDASPDPHWLTYLAHTFSVDGYAGVGGPNIAPPVGGLLSECLRRAPGNPVHVLLSDTEAEHIAGCNMAFRREPLLEIGGFDPQYRVAGDDVDVCWRIQDAGHRLGFSHSAMVWHHPRSTISSFWRQQVGYGRAEAMLVEKWPEKYNHAGQAKWLGRVYGAVVGPLLQRSDRVYHGTWGSAPFQSLYEGRPGPITSLVASPGWYLMILGLLVLSLFAFLWAPLLSALPILSIALGLSVARAIQGSLGVPVDPRWSSPPDRVRMRALMTLLYLQQPVARAWGRVRWAFTKWRRPGFSGLSLPYPRQESFWSEEWRAPEERVHRIEQTLKAWDVDTHIGGGFDRFDIEVRGRTMGSARLLVGVEEHGEGRQLIRTRVWPRVGRLWALTILLGIAAATGAAILGASLVSWLMGLTTLTLGVIVLWECAGATAVVRKAVSTSVGTDTS